MKTFLKSLIYPVMCVVMMIFGCLIGAYATVADKNVAIKVRDYFGVSEQDSNKAKCEKVPLGFR